MHVFRNWLLPVTLTGLGTVLGLIAIGLPGVNVVQTIDGSPVVGGYVPEEDVTKIINQGKVIGSYVDFYGLALHGQPFFWMIGVVAVFTFIGFTVGRRFRARGLDAR